MSVRIAGLCTLLFALLVLLGTVGCQNQPGNAAIDRLTETVNKLSDQMVTQMVTKKDLGEAGKGWATKAELDEVRADVRLAKADLKANIDAVAEQNAVQGQLVAIQKHLPQRLARVEAELKDTSEQLVKVKGELKANIDVVAEQSVVQGQIARRDRDGNHILAIDKMRKDSKEFQNEFTGAVRESFAPVQQQGLLHVTNLMGYAIYLKVEGLYYWIQPYTNVDIVVPLGMVTTELVGYESPKNWWIGAPDYTRRIVINPVAPPPTELYFSWAR